MAPARPRINVDDSRSEASSVVAHQKEKSMPGAAGGSGGVTKGKRSHAAAAGVNGLNGGNSKAPGTNAAVPVPPSTNTEAEKEPKDPNLPRTNWTTMSVPILRTYRIAHRLATPSVFNHPHADLTYASSELASRAPSAVHARRKLHEQKLLQRRKLLRQQAQTNGTAKGKKSKEKDKDKDKDKSSKDTNMTDHPSNDNAASSVIAQSIEPPDQASEPGLPPLSPSSSAVPYLGPREPPTQLATAVRKHFNAQQLNEADTIARFIYVVQQKSRGVRTEGSTGDGSGYWMGSHGRAVRKIDGPGGEVGFRLRFRP